MGKLADDHSAIFAAGYDRGKTDGLGCALALLQLIVSYGGRIPPKARVIVPQPWADEICDLVDSYGEHCYRNGRKYEKDRRQAKDAEQVSEGAQVNAKAG